MTDRLAKIMVICLTGLSLVFMTWTVMVFLQFNDYGWKEPMKVWETKDTGYRIPSILDKRTAVLYELYRQKERAIPNVAPALESLSETMEYFPKNHEFYVKELDTIRNSDQPITPKQLTWKDGELQLDTEKGRLGKPLMKTQVGGIDKSLKAITAERDKILADIEKITPEIEKLVREADDITIQLYGTKDNKGRSVDIGLYEVLENETILQDKIREEKEDITPRYVDAERRAATFRNRLEGMRRQMTPVNREK
jgi:hypothetical protein